MDFKKWNVKFSDFLVDTNIFMLILNDQRLFNSHLMFKNVIIEGLNSFYEGALVIIENSYFQVWVYMLTTTGGENGLWS